MDKKLTELFFEVSENEIESLCLSQSDIFCESDKEMQKRIMTDVSGRIKAGKKGLTAMKNKRIKTVLIAAALIIVLALSATAGYKYLIPDAMLKMMNSSFDSFTLDSIKSVVDTESASEDEISVINKTVTSDGYIITFEAIADATRVRTSYFSFFEDKPVNPKTETENIKYAVFTLKREDGKQVMYGIDENDTLDASGIGFLPIVHGYMANPCMWEELHDMAFYEEENVVYILYSITEAAIFADHDLSIAFTTDFVISTDEMTMNDDGSYAFVQPHEGIEAIFDFDLPDELADKEKQQEYIKTGSFFTKEEFEIMQSESE